MKRSKTKINPLTLVVFDKGSCSKDDYKKYYKDTFHNRLLIFVGEVTNAPGHCILTDLADGKLIGMYHTENFREANISEL